MYKISLDQNALIGLQGGENTNEILHHCNNKDNLLFIQDANIGEAFRQGSDSFNRIIKSIKPFKDRVRIGPTHTQIMKNEIGSGKPASPRSIQHFNERTDACNLIDRVLSGDLNTKKALNEPIVRNELDKSFSLFKHVMINRYNSLSDAINTNDKKSGEGRRDRIRYKFRKSDSINDDVLDMTIKLSIASMRHDTIKWKGDVRKTYKICRSKSYHLAHGIAGWVRVCQQIQKGNMQQWLENDSSKITNEYFDVLHASFSPYYDNVLTFDNDTLKTIEYIKRAFVLYDKNQDKYLLHAANLEKYSE
jgi:hypothetical protein